MERSPLRRLAELRGSTERTATESIARWSAEDRDLLVRIGLLDGPPGHGLTDAGRDVLKGEQEG